MLIACLNVDGWRSGTREEFVEDAGRGAIKAGKEDSKKRSLGRSIRKET